MIEIIAHEDLLPEIDRDFLHRKENSFEIIPEGGQILLIFKDYSFPPFYTPPVADLLIVIPSGYPNAPLDMFWTSPDVKLANGSYPKTADQHHQFNGKIWQRWSRHGTWRSGIDSLKTFLASVRKEIDKGI